MGRDNGFRKNKKKRELAVIKVQDQGKIIKESRKNEQNKKKKRERKMYKKEKSKKGRQKLKGRKYKKEQDNNNKTHIHRNIKTRVRER